MGNTLFEDVGGRAVISRVMKVFYDKLYAHPRLKGFFREIDQKFIEKQQTDYVTMQMGGGQVFSGKMPRNCHQHMLITEELNDIRSALLRESILECGIAPALAEQWLSLSKPNLKEILKTDISQCKKRFPTDEIFTAPPK